MVQTWSDKGAFLDRSGEVACEIQDRILAGAQGESALTMRETMVTMYQERTADHGRSPYYFGQNMSASSASYRPQQAAKRSAASPKYSWRPLSFVTKMDLTRRGTQVNAVVMNRLCLSCLT